MKKLLSYAATALLTAALTLPAAVDRTDPLGDPLARKVRHELVMLPWYSIWDNLKFRVDEGGRVTLMGQTVRPV